MDTIEQLAIEINEKMNHGIKLKNMIDIIKKYNGDDWEKHKQFCDNKYTRNLAFRNDKFEILIICWNKGQKSCIHDHPDNGCLVKLVKGCLVEECYSKINDKLTLVSTNNINKDDVSYQEGSDGLHRIINPSLDNCCVTIHIYSPPNYTPNFY